MANDIIHKLINHDVFNKFIVDFHDDDVLIAFLECNMYSHVCLMVYNILGDKHDAYRVADLLFDCYHSCDNFGIVLYQSRYHNMIAGDSAITKKIFETINNYFVAIINRKIDKNKVDKNLHEGALERMRISRSLMTR
jgi:hypothetical protein